MFGRFWNCLKRHKRKVILFSAFFGGGWLTYRWLQNKMRELRDQDNKHYLERMKRQQHFDSNQRTCNMTAPQKPLFLTKKGMTFLMIYNKTGPHTEEWGDALDKQALEEVEKFYHISELHLKRNILLSQDYSRCLIDCHSVPLTQVTEECLFSALRIVKSDLREAMKPGLLETESGVGLLKFQESELDIFLLTTQLRSKSRLHQQQVPGPVRHHVADEVLSMLPNLRETLNKVLSSEQITHLLQNNPSNKMLLWEELKVVSLARVVTGVYGCCLMSLLLRVQLNLMSGYIFLSTMNGIQVQANLTKLKESQPIQKEVQERYLSLISYFLNQGLTDLASFVKQAAAREIQSISLKELMTIDYVQTVINSIRERVECGATELNHEPATLPLCQYLLPGEQVPGIEVQTEEELFDKLVKATRDILESADFHLVLQESLDRGFSRFMDILADHYRQKMDTRNPPMGLHEVTIPCAKLLPIADSTIAKMLCDAPNSFVQELLLLEQMKNLAANIYEAFSQEQPTPEE